MNSPTMPENWRHMYGLKAHEAPRVHLAVGETEEANKLIHVGFEVVNGQAVGRSGGRVETVWIKRYGDAGGSFQACLLRFCQ